MVATFFVVAVASMARAPAAWRALQSVPTELENRGKLAGTPPCLASLQKAAGMGRSAAWHLGRLTRDGAELAVLVQLDNNPIEPSCALTFVDEQAGSRIGRVLLVCGENESWLRGMEIREDLRGRGLAKVFIATWLRLCAESGLSPGTRTINKPLISLSLERFGFEPVAADCLPLDECPTVRGERVTVGQGPTQRTASVRTAFKSPADVRSLDMAIDDVLGGDGLRVVASPRALRQALTLRGGSRNRAGL